jgi:hypothetical protein
MFAPPIAKSKVKPTGRVPAQRFGESGVATPQVLPRLGNQAMLRNLSRAPERVPAPLKIGEADHPLEREADRVASGILRMPGERLGSAASVSAQHCAGRCAGATPAFAPPIVDEVLRSPGQPLDSETRAFMEPRFGQDFSQVRLHTDEKAGQSARAVNALAYSAEHHLVFGANQYSPTSSSSRQLIAHELAHFVQQRSASSPVLRRQPAPAIELPTREETSAKAQYQGHEGDDLAVKLLELADQGVRNSASYKDAIRTSGPIEKRYVYRNSYTLVRLAEILDLAAYDQCVVLLDPDARGRVLAGMARIKKKYGLGEVSEDGIQWTEGELAIADRNFSKMSRPEQEMLHGIHLIRKKEIPPEKRHGKQFPIGGRTTGGSTIELTQVAFQDRILMFHELGHLIQQKQPMLGMQALSASGTFANMKAAWQKYDDAAKEARKSGGADPVFANSVNEMVKAVGVLVDSPLESIQDARDRLDVAEGQAQIARSNEHSKPWLDAHDRLNEYAATVEQWATEKQEIQGKPAEIEKNFVAIVKRYRLDNRGFAPFTDYVAHSWPDQPQEFLVQCYGTWRADPDYLRRNAPGLFAWFESGGHLGINKPTR